MHYLTLARVPSGISFQYISCAVRISVVAKQLNFNAKCRMIFLPDLRRVVVHRRRPPQSERLIYLTDGLT